jgi:hypothetical protein
MLWMFTGLSMACQPADGKISAEPGKRIPRVAPVPGPGGQMATRVPFSPRATFHTLVMGTKSLITNIIATAALTGTRYQSARLLEIAFPDVFGDERVFVRPEVKDEAVHVRWDARYVIPTVREAYELVRSRVGDWRPMDIVNLVGPPSRGVSPMMFTAMLVETVFGRRWLDAIGTFFVDKIKPPTGEQEEPAAWNRMPTMKEIIGASPADVAYGAAQQCARMTYFGGRVLRMDIGETSNWEVGVLILFNVTAMGWDVWDNKRAIIRQLTDCFRIDRQLSDEQLLALIHQQPIQGQPTAGETLLVRAITNPPWGFAQFASNAPWYLTRPLMCPAPFIQLINMDINSLGALADEQWTHEHFVTPFSHWYLTFVVPLIRLSARGQSIRAVPNFHTAGGLAAYANAWFIAIQAHRLFGGICHYETEVPVDVIKVSRGSAMAMYSRRTWGCFSIRTGDYRIRPVTWPTEAKFWELFSSLPLAWEMLAHLIYEVGGRTDGDALAFIKERLGVWFDGADSLVDAAASSRAWNEIAALYPLYRGMPVTFDNSRRLFDDWMTEAAGQYVIASDNAVIGVGQPVYSQAGTFELSPIPQDVWFPLDVDALPIRDTGYLVDRHPEVVDGGLVEHNAVPTAIIADAPRAFVFSCHTVKKGMVPMSVELKLDRTFRDLDLEGLVIDAPIVDGYGAPRQTIHPVVDVSIQLVQRPYAGHNPAPGVLDLDRVAPGAGLQYALPANSVQVGIDDLQPDPVADPSDWPTSSEARITPQRQYIPVQLYALEGFLLKIVERTSAQV